MEHVQPVLVLPELPGDVALQRLHLLPHVAAVAAVLVPLQGTFREILQLRLLRHLGGDRPQDPLHHGEVLQTGVSVEHHESHGQLEDDAADAPDVTGLIPAWREEVNVDQSQSQ